MARPSSNGLQYFPLDVYIFEDDKLKDLNYYYGPLAEMVYIRILTMVYANGYYIETSLEDLARRLHRQMGPSWIKLDRVRSLINGCLEMRLFDKELAAQRVITSGPIQKQFILSTRRRQNVYIDKYCLLDQQTMIELKVLLSMSKNKGTDDKNEVNVDNNSVNVDIKKQSKSKSKVKLDKIDKIDKRIFGHPKIHFITKSLIDNHYIEESNLDLIRYNQLFDELIAEYGFDRALSAVNYMIKYSKRDKQPIENKYAYMKDALVHNLEMFRKRENRSNETFESWMEQVLFSVDNKD